MIQIQRFRLLFVHDAERTSVKIEQLHLHPYAGGPSFNQEDNSLWRWHFLFFYFFQRFRGKNGVH